MKIMVLSKDPELIESTRSVNHADSWNVKVYNYSSDPLDVVSNVCIEHPGILVIDDDYLNPSSGHILASIKKMLDDLAIIFVTSNSDIELGREVSQMGVYYYAVKPLEEDALIDSLKSIVKLRTKAMY
jgi:FixJ family two-component response regulator